MTDRKRRPGRKPRETTRLGNTSGNPTTPSTPPEDLSSTIQDPDAPPRRPEASGALRGPELPRTAEGERDFSSMGRAEPQGADDARPARRRGFVPVREPSPPAPRFDLAPFRRDGSYDMQAIMVVRMNWERLRREEGERRSILGRMWGGERGGRERPPRVGGRAVGGRLLSNLSERSEGGEGEGEGEKKVAGGGGVDDVDEDDFYGASPVRPGPSNVLPAQKEDEKRKGKEKEQEKRPQDKKSDIAFGKPKSPKASPVKEQSSLWSKLFSRAQKTSPTKSEKYRKLAANETAQLTEKEKFDYWMKHELSSPRAVVADENEWQKEMELLYAREKHIAQLQQAKADASAMISQGDKESHERQELEEMISQCDLHLLEAEELEDKRQWRRSLQTSLGLETSPTFLAKFNDQLRDLNAKIEDDEKKERLRLKPWVDVSPDWAARLQKASDMTPSERAASSAGRGLHAPARPPGQLKQSSAEKALRVKWATEDSPHENELLEIQTYSDEMERDVAWGLAMRKRQSVLLARHKELSDLWTKQAEEMRADRESAWLESTGEKRIPISEPQSRAASMQQSKGLGEGTGGSGAGQYDILSDKQKQEKKDEEDEKNEMAREEAEGSKKMSRAEMKNAGRLGERRAGRQGIFNTSGLRQMPEMEPGPSSMRKRSMDVIPNPSETPASRSRKSTTPERPLSPFRATKAISPLQEGRQKPVFHVDSEVSEYLESLTQCRIRLEMQKKGVEMVDLDVMRKLVGTVAKPIVISVEGAAEDVAAMERRATRIREAKERLALAAKGEVERLREDEEKKRKKEEKEKEQGEEEKLSFKEMMEKLKRERAERQEKEQKRQRIELERRKKEEEDMAVEREEKRREREREDGQRERDEMLEWIADRVKRRRLEKERRERSGNQESRTNRERRELKEKEEEEEEVERKNEVERRQKKRAEDDDRERIEDKKRRERADRERREIYEREVRELKEMQEKEKIGEIERPKVYIQTEREIGAKKDELKRQERENEEIIASEEREERERKAKAENEVKERTERAKRQLKEGYEREIKELEDSKRDDQARRDRKERYEREAEERAKRQREENEQRKIKEAEDKARREREQQARRESIRKAKRDMEGFEKNQREKEIKDQEEKELEQQREIMDREIADQLKKESDGKRQREQCEQREEEARKREEPEAEERENAERQRIIDDEFDSDDEEQYGPIEQHFLKYLIRILSWCKRRDPENTETGSSVHSRSSLHSVLESPDHSVDSKTTSYGTPPPETIDPNSPPDSPFWLRDHGPDLSTLDDIHLHLTIFSSPDQRHPNPSTPIYYATYRDVPLWWNVSQLKRYLGRGSVRSGALHGLDETFPGCVGWVKEDGKAIQEGDAEEKKIRLRVAGRWLKSGGRTLRDEGLRDYENLVVVLVGKDDDLGSRGWRNCLLEADGVAGFKEGWPGKGEIRAPADRVAWLGEAMDGVFGVFGVE